MIRYKLRFIKEWIREIISDFFKYDMYIVDDTPKTLGTHIKRNS